MNLNPMKDAGNTNGQGGGQGQGPTTTIPSLKRTLSGGASGVHGGGPHGMGGHLGVGMNSIPSVLHTNNPTAPPQMLRAVTSSGVFNRPVSSVGSLRGGSSLGGGGLGGGSSSSLAGGPSSSVAGSATRSISQSSMQDWRMYLTIEERQAVRSKIRDAYTNRCSTYEDLLQVACAIEEELLHISAPSRLDYFKSGFEFENRVKLKKDQLQGQLAALDTKRRPTISPSTNAQGTSSGGNNNNNGGNGSSSGASLGAQTSSSSNDTYKKQRT